MQYAACIKKSSGNTCLHFIITAFFTHQLAKAEKEMDQMFTKAYDNQYTQNKEVFKQLYNSFKRFYSGEDMDISRVIHQV